jgi:DNA-binding MarR family transcriptional regulator
MDLQLITEHSLVYHIFDLSATIRKNGEQIASQIDLTTQQWMILLLLAGDPNHPYANREDKKELIGSDLADALGVSRPNITNLVLSLADKGLIIQIEDELDRRKKRLQLTPAAYGHLSAIEPLRKNANENLFSEFTLEEKAQFLIYLKRCLRFLNR